ncbi:MAG: hypothetical protein G01um101430_354 [Parcubacteria group bacterium Gr01-1014_30]|nr:MAG: hypothetical protein G01um101430_354 [Parcubacteria group bacterium Gr01-1014_30]
MRYFGKTRKGFLFEGRRIMKVMSDKIKKSVKISAVLFCLFFVLVWVNAHEVAVIRMDDNAYYSKSVEIHEGDTVSFKNTGKNDKWPASNIHPTHEIYTEFDAGKPVTPNQSWSFVFGKPGVWQYHDHLYPKITGTITVLASGENELQDASQTNFFKNLAQKLKAFFKKLLAMFDRKAESRNPKVEFISRDSTEIFTDTTALKFYIQNYGAAATVQQLNALSSSFGSCHDQAHKAGRITYELGGDRAFRECGAECHSGCYHGATEAYFREKGTANLAAGLKTLCSSELNPFFSHQCIHGIGHGLMAWANYEIFDALLACDLLPERQDSCWTGVFMENIVGGLGKESGHYTSYLSDDPHHPCDIVDEKYKGSCYFLQTSRMVQLFNGDFKKVATSCLEAPVRYQRDCFQSMGRDVGGSARKNPSRAIELCRLAPKGSLRNDCLGGAVQDSFWDPTGQDDALSFCRLLTEKDEKDLCYGVIFQRAPEVLTSKEELEKFCSKAESDYQTLCLQ